MGICVFAEFENGGIKAYFATCHKTELLSKLANMTNPLAMCFVKGFSFCLRVEKLIVLLEGMWLFKVDRKLGEEEEEKEQTAVLGGRKGRMSGA